MKSRQNSEPESTIDYVAEAGVARIALNRPARLNAVVPQLVRELLDAIEQAHRDGVRVIVLSGRGRAFCSGYDLKHEVVGSPSADERVERLARIQALTTTLRGSPCCVIAQVHGYALGAGAELALAADFVVAAEDAVFGFPEVEAGLSVTGGVSAVLPRLVGPARARRLMILGERIDGKQAYDLGLVSHVSTAGELPAVVDALADTVLSRPRRAVEGAKLLLEQGTWADLADALDAEVRSALRAQDSGEAREAQERFAAGRGLRMAGDA
ncbi:enoyl-CoA hydratase-related protein [Sphaerimonospora mesophila]|uniref:enoyl-CoA hydratase/isomerase family protein n=1 Tax=Sphaerimonospora mesophila TaxID=37483 RepID=UPI0006E44951